MAASNTLCVGDYPALKGYPEKKIRADGKTYTVYVKPFYVDLLQGDGTIKPRQFRKVQSEPYDAENTSQAINAASQATLRAAQKVAEAKSAIESFRLQKTAEPKRPQTLREVAVEMQETSIKFDARGVSRGLKQGTVTKYAKHMANLGRESYPPPLADVSLDLLTLGDVRKHFRAYSSAHNASGTSKYRAYLIQIGGYALSCDYWTKNIFKELPKVSVPEPDAIDNLALSLLQIKKLNRQARDSKNPRLPAYLRLLRIGLRASEVLALSEDDIDTDKNFVHVRYSLIQDQPDWAKAQGRTAVAYLDEPKSRESRRNIKVHSAFMADIQESRKLAKPCEIPAYDDGGKTRAYKFLIPNKQGGVWLYNNALRMVRAEVYLKAKIDLRLKKAGEEPSTNNARWNHIWRNSYAADLVALGADDSELAQLMRHTDVNLSKKTYASVRKDSRHAYRSFAEKIRRTDIDFNWQIGEIDIDLDQNERSPFIMRQMTFQEVTRPHRTRKETEELFKL